MAENNFYPVQDNKIEGIDTERGSAFVDLAGLEYFWNNAKEYIDTGDSQPIDLLSDNVVSKPFDIYKTYIGNSDGEYEYSSGLPVFKDNDIRYNCAFVYIEGHGLRSLSFALGGQTTFSDGSAIRINISEDLTKITLQYFKLGGTPATAEDECYGKKVYIVTNITPIHRAYLPEDLTDIKASQIILEYQQTISEEDKLQMYVLKSKTGFEEHNLSVVKRLAAALSSDGQSTQDQEMFFATFNGNINGSNEVFSAPLHGIGQELVTGEIRSAIPGLGFESIYTIGIDSEVLKGCAIENSIDDLYFKLVIAIKETETEEVYTTDFVFGELVRGRATASRELLNAVKNGKIIRIPRNVPGNTDNMGYIIANATISSYKDSVILNIEIIEQYSQNYPYAIAAQAEFKTDTTSATLTIVHENILPTKPDWSIGWDSNPNYIANRTHYHNQYGTFRPGQRYSIADQETIHDLNNYRLFFRGDLFKIQEGKFTITKDNTSITFNCVGSESGKTITWTLSPVSFSGFEENEYITVVSKLGNYKPLDEFYLPDEVLCESIPVSEIESFTYIEE